MAFDRIFLADLEHFVAGMSKDELASLIDAERDPARKLPEMPKTQASAVAPGVPSVSTIEQALLEHIHGGESPRDLIAELFAPFVNPHLIDLEPGKGLKRPSYALSISTHGFVLRRASVSDIASRLHAIGAAVSRYEVGPRAPEGALDYLLHLPMSDGYPMVLSVTAASTIAARAAFQAAFGRTPVAVSVPLPFDAKAIVPHVVAARHLLAQGSVGAPRLRKKAVSLIAAAEDVRAVASVALRRNPEVSSFSRFTIDLSLDKGFSISVDEDRVERGSAHAEMQFLARHRDLLDALERVAARHDVLRDLPDAYVLRLRGTPTYLDCSLVNRDAPRHAPERTISSLDYSDIGALAERLANLDADERPERAQWRLVLSGGRFRSKRDWTLHGETLAQALAKAAEADSISASMALIDLAIDLSADEDGAITAVALYRVL